MSLTNTNPLILILFSILFLTGLSLVIAGSFGFYWIAHEIYIAFSKEQVPIFLEQFLSHINEQTYQASAKSEDDKDFVLSISAGVAEWIYALLAIFLLRTVPSMLKILISTGATIMLSPLNSLDRLLESKKSEPDNDDASSKNENKGW